MLLKQLLLANACHHRERERQSEFQELSCSPPPLSLPHLPGESRRVRGSFPHQTQDE